MSDNRIMDRTVGQWVAEDYRASAVFEKHGIDFCCGGGLSLGAACEQKMLDPAILVRELEAIRQLPAVGRDSEAYFDWTLDRLTDHIVRAHHSYVVENTGQLEHYTRKVAGVHGSRHPELTEIAGLFEKLTASLLAHLEDEESVAFPAVRRLVRARDSGSGLADGDKIILERALAQLRQEHDEVGNAIHEIRRLAHDFEVPADACNTFALTYRKLKEFEDDLHKHVHLENNILFPGVKRLLEAG